MGDAADTAAIEDRETGNSHFFKNRDVSLFLIFFFLRGTLYFMVISFGGFSGEKYIWTNHARMKMRRYRLAESRIKRIIRHPARVEEGIIENGIACMQRAESKNYSEIWAMYVVAKSKAENGKSKIRIITAWRYPGKSPTRNPVPPEVLREIQNLLSR